MCGIVGYCGFRNPKEIILQGLKKLEYRGYDSAGLAILHQGQFKRIRAEGKLINLEKKVLNEEFNGHLGIGHTRWATHGSPSERNAHPHQVEGINLVHNGIIENYLEIREALQKRGAKITSDTDSELVAHLIAEEVKTTNNLFKAIQMVLSKLKGAFSILVSWDKEPNELIAFKDGPPLVVGLGLDEVFIVSDVHAAIQYTQKFVYVEDREIVHVKDAQVAFYTSEGKLLSKKAIEINWSPDQVEKKGFAHYMLKEIFEQPLAVASALAPHIDLDTHKVNLKNVGFSSLAKTNLGAAGAGIDTAKMETKKGLDAPEMGSLDFDSKKDWQNTLEVFHSVSKITIVACGTSYYAGLLGKYLIESIARLPVEVDVASEYRYRKPLVTSETLVLTISQSGETADTLAAIRLAKSLGAKTLSICNVKNSTIDREADGHLYMNSGPEIGVASTKAFVSTLSILNLLALSLSKAKGLLTEKMEVEYTQALLALPSQLEVVLAHNKYFEEAAGTLEKFRGFLYLGRGVSFPIALEGALKMKELAYLHAEGYAAGEMKHGPLALIDSQMAIVTLAPQDEHYEKTLSNLEEAKARGGKIISIGTEGNKKLRALSDQYLSIPKAHWFTNPLLFVVPLQLMAYHVANHMKHDVDQPRNLAKSVTVE